MAVDAKAEQAQKEQKTLAEQASTTSQKQSTSVRTTGFLSMPKTEFVGTKSWLGTKEGNTTDAHQDQKPVENTPAASNAEQLATLQQQAIYKFGLLALELTHVLSIFQLTALNTGVFRQQNQSAQSSSRDAQDLALLNHAIQEMAALSAQSSQATLVFNTTLTSQDGSAKSGSLFTQHNEGAQQNKHAHARTQATLRAIILAFDVGTLRNLEAMMKRKMPHASTNTSSVDEEQSDGERLQEAQSKVLRMLESLLKKLPSSALFRSALQDESEDIERLRMLIRGLEAALASSRVGLRLSARR